MRAWRPDLLNLPGADPIVAATVLSAWSHPGRCRNDAFAMLAGTAPIPASSGKTVRYRLNRPGDRQLNRALHTVALYRLHRDPRTRAYADRHRAEGKTDREIKRCLKRYIARESSTDASKHRRHRLTRHRSVPSPSQALTQTCSRPPGQPSCSDSSRPSPACTATSRSPAAGYCASTEGDRRRGQVGRQVPAASSDPQLSAEDIALGYKRLMAVERSWRDMKQILDLRPVYHRREHRIRAHVLLRWLALLLTCLVETHTGRTWTGVRAELQRLHVGTFTGPAGTFRKRTELTGEQKAILTALRLPHPPRVLAATPA